MDGWDGMGGYLPCPALQATTRSKRSKEIMPSCCALESSPPHPTQPTTDGYKCPGRIRHATGRTRLPNPNRSTARHGDPAKPAITTPRRFHSKHKCRTTATARTHGRPAGQAPPSSSSSLHPGRGSRRPTPHALTQPRRRRAGRAPAPPSIRIITTHPTAIEIPSHHRPPPKSNPINPSIHPTPRAEEHPSRDSNPTQPNREPQQQRWGRRAAPSRACAAPASAWPAAS
jgi:hypothetical protein